ncbi:SCO family protein [Salibaculum halophilum]|uniref:SCO family protein n=1 Tax=Salibaculum halophilum TaxID=1914408 RepID=UPI000A106093|nr:SCO family protein [Salibaculum halophilum]
MRLTFLQKILWALVGVAALAFVWLLLWADYRSDQTAEGEPALRADFELTDHTGMVRTQEDYAGRWMMVFFGFANCPDVCPTTLAEVAAVIDGLGADAAQVQPLFITIDPERDTPSVLASFVPRFEAGIVGLTGTPDQIDRTADSFHIFYEKVEEAAAPGGYTMGHSSQLFLFDPEGGYVKAWSYGTPAEEILADLRGRVAG